MAIKKYTAEELNALPISALIRLAVADAQAVQKAGHTLDMNAWVVQDGKKKKCEVCFAGAVMLRREGLNALRPDFIECEEDEVSFGPTGEQQYALDLNSVRTGDFADISKLYKLPSHSLEALERTVRTDFRRRRDGGRANWATYLKVADTLEGIGF